VTPEEHIEFWKKAANEADTKGLALTAFGVYAGLSMAEEEYKSVLKKLVFAARTSGGVAGRDELLCSACDAAERLLRIEGERG
jgi:hypothetical protein